MKDEMRCKEELMKTNKTMIGLAVAATFGSLLSNPALAGDPLEEALMADPPKAPVATLQSDKPSSPEPVLQALLADGVNDGTSAAPKAALPASSSPEQPVESIASEPASSVNWWLVGGLGAVLAVVAAGACVASYRTSRNRRSFSGGGRGSGGGNGVFDDVLEACGDAFDSMGDFGGGGDGGGGGGDISSTPKLRRFGGVSIMAP